MLHATHILTLMVAGSATAEPNPAFEREIRPILKAACFQCHGEAEEPEGGLDLRLARLMITGGDSGSAITPGRRAESLIYQRIRDGEMPPPEKGHLTDEQVELIGRWIDAGAKTLRSEPETLGAYVITEEERSHWSFQPIVRPSVPSVTGDGRTPIDAFLLARLQEAGFEFSPAAPRETRIRRAYLDLLGLPPTPEQLRRHLADDSPDADERMIDDLLASPHYGERWGRHWLDVAGYADSDGYSVNDTERRWSYKYRDYVIRAFAADMPFDQFIREQLAGDELITSPLDNLTPADADKLAATGFLRMAPDGTRGKVDDVNLARNDVMAETIKIVSSSLLGLTIGCAQCHDHRYDPIPQRDYYRFRAIFEPALDWKNWRNPQQRLVSLYTDEDRAQAAEIEAQAKEVEAERTAKQQEFISRTFAEEVEKLPEEERELARAGFETPAKERTPEQTALFKKYPSLNVDAGSLYLYDKKAADELKALADRAAKICGTKPVEEFLHCLTEPAGHLPETMLFARGDHHQPREAVTPAELTIVSLTTDSAEIAADNPELATTGRRTAFAESLTSPEHPLVSRVIVNRIWLHHFGRGLVPTLGDFGALGEAPSHPELLDWLAAEFIDSGWSVKHLHRLIMGSAAYQQSLRTDPAQDTADPDNALYGGSRIRRLDAEVVRDAILAASGTLNDQLYGAPIPVMADPVGRWVLGIENLNAGRPGEELPLNGQESRRSVYVQVRRSRPLAVLDTFDWPRMSPNCDIRRSSTATPQSLMLMNSDFVLEHSAQLADRLEEESAAWSGLAADVPPQALSDARIGYAWRLVFSRSATESELASARTFLEEQAEIFRETGDQEDGPSPERRALESLCQMLLSSNEFLYTD